MAQHDISNFSSPPHRLKTLSASQALQDLSSSPRKPIPSRLKSLDAILQGQSPSNSSQNSSDGGLSRGQVTEVYGPPGVGKTTFALQISASALHSGNAVVWIAASSGLAGPRLKEIVSEFHITNQESSTSSAIGISSGDRMSDFHHFTTPTLPHLLALCAHESSTFPPKGTGLIVVDSVSSLFAAAFPRANDDSDTKQTPEKPKKNDAGQWAASRKWAVMGELVSKLGKLAATNNIAILLTCETTTRIRMETGAMLHPAISGIAWESGISARIVLFRDWLFDPAKSSSQEGYMPGMRFAGILKAGGVSFERLEKIVSFLINKRGLHEVTLEATSVDSNHSLVTPAPSFKRKRIEIGDSQSEDEKGGSDEEFGWDDDDDPLAVHELANR